MAGWQKLKGTIHKRSRQFFRIFDTSLPHVGTFLVLAVGNFDQFFDPSPLPIAEVVYGRPQIEIMIMIIMLLVISSSDSFITV